MFGLGGSLGAAFLGNLASAILYGITIVQTCTYYSRRTDDQTPMKALVGLLLTLDSVHLGLVTYGVYARLITHFGVADLKPEPILMIQILITSINNVIIRMLFALRVWRLSKKNWPLLGVMIFAAWFAFAGVAVYFIVFLYKVFKVTPFWDIHELDWVLYISLSSGAFVDIFTCGALFIVLQRSRTGWERTDSLITTVSLYTINTGVLVSLFSILTLLTARHAFRFYCHIARSPPAPQFALLPDTLVYIAIYFCMDSVFFNALLATLNVRAGLRERLGLLPPARARRTARVHTTDSGGFVKLETHSEPGPPPPRKPLPARARTRAAFELPIQPVPLAELPQRESETSSLGTLPSSV